MTRLIIMCAVHSISQRPKSIWAYKAHSPTCNGHFQWNTFITHYKCKKREKLWHTFDLRNKFLHCHIRQVFWSLHSQQPARSAATPPQLNENCMVFLTSSIVVAHTAASIACCCFCFSLLLFRLYSPQSWIFVTWGALHTPYLFSWRFG